MHDARTYLFTWSFLPYLRFVWSTRTVLENDSTHPRSQVSQMVYTIEALEVRLSVDLSIIDQYDETYVPTGTCTQSFSWCCSQWCSLPSIVSTCNCHLFRYVWYDCMPISTIVFYVCAVTTLFILTCVHNQIDPQSHSMTSEVAAWLSGQCVYYYTSIWLYLNLSNT